RALDARFDETIDHLNDHSLRLLRRNLRRDGLVRRRNLLKGEDRHGVSPHLMPLETSSRTQFFMTFTSQKVQARLTQAQQFNHNKSRIGSTLPQLRTSPPHPKVFR